MVAWKIRTECTCTSQLLMLSLAHSTQSHQSIHEPLTRLAFARSCTQTDEERGMQKPGVHDTRRQAATPLRATSHYVCM